MRRHLLLFVCFLLSFCFLCDANKGSASLSSKKKQANVVCNIGEKLPVSSPEEVGINSGKLKGIDSIAIRGISHHAYPGCQVVVAKDGKMIYNKCFGTYTYESDQPVTSTTLFDLASLSKTTGTLLAVMKLYDEGRLKLSDKASDYLSFLKGTDKVNISIRELLFHESGLPAGLPFQNIVFGKGEVEKDVTDTTVVKAMRPVKRELVSTVQSEEFPYQAADRFFLHKSIHQKALEMIAKAKLHAKVYEYSCVNFIVLKEIVETISGEKMENYLNKNFYEPMGLQYTCYLPLRYHNAEEVAPTMKREYLRCGMIQGYVHDPSAAFLGGVSGNAGLFSTATEVARIYQMLLNDGELEGKRYLKEETCRTFTTTYSASGRRTLGFDKSLPDKPDKSPCCPLAPVQVFGHTGYTGTCCWVDPVNRLVYVFLSNRTYPDDNGNKLSAMRIRPGIQEVIYESLQ